jgi:hypothetical protein
VWERTSGKIHSSTDGTTWTTTAQDFGGNGIQCAALFNGWVLFGSIDSGALYRFDGTTWDLWTTLAGTGVSALTRGTQSAAEVLYAGMKTSAGRGQLLRINTTASSTTIYSTTHPELPALLQVGANLWCSSMDDTAGVRGALLVYDGATVELHTELPDNAICAFATWRDKILCASRTRGKLWSLAPSDPLLQLGGQRELFRIPDVEGIGGLSSYALRIWQLSIDNDRIHVPVVDTNGLGTYVSEDGAGWFLPNTGGLGQEPRGCVAFNGKLFLSTKSNAGARVYEVSSAYPTSATLLTQWFDNDSLPTTKTFLSFTLYHSALNANESLTVDYALDGATSWTSLGVSDVDGEQSKTLTFAASVTGARIRFRITWALTDTTKAPRLDQFDLEWSEAEASVTRKSSWEFAALFEGTAELPQVLVDQAVNPSTGAQLSDAAWVTKGKATTVAFVDLDGASYTVWVDALEEKVSQRSQREGLSTRGAFTLREA